MTKTDDFKASAQDKCGTGKTGAKDGASTVISIRPQPPGPRPPAPSAPAPRAPFGMHLMPVAASIRVLPAAAVVKDKGAPAAKGGTDEE
jgi:hypothetical protein